MGQPKKTKYKKARKGKLKKLEFKSNIGGLINSNQIEAARKAIARKIERNGKIWICVFPHLPITCKPTESRMGKGKGSVCYWSAKVKGGTTLFEICGIPKYIAVEALKAGSKKLPIKTKIFD